MIVSLDTARPWVHGNAANTVKVVQVQGQPFTTALRWTFPTATEQTWEAGMNVDLKEPLLANQTYALVIPYRSGDMSHGIHGFFSVKKPGDEKMTQLTELATQGSASWQAWRLLITPKRNVPVDGITISLHTGGNQGMVEVGEATLRLATGSLPEYKAVTIE